MEPLSGGPRSPVQRWLTWWGGTRVGSWVFARVLHRVDRAVFRWSGGRWTATSALSGLPVVMLTTTGARTGMPRTVPVLGLPIGADVAVAAGNFGRSRDPGWCVNLRREPRALLAVRGRSAPVVAEELTGGPREAVWQQAILVYPGAAAYQRRAGGRTIGVFLLRPADPAGQPEPPPAGRTGAS